ncbi:MAG: hypothetical protein M3Q10_06200 [Chloroflexota bacterium]|nr:hypothetical protein [Chloroflexota bacterium]
MAERFSVGTEVFAADGEKVGEIVAVHPDYVVVQAGLLFPTDAYVPRAAIAAAGSGRVALSVSKDQALGQGWSSPPAGADRDQEAAILATGDQVRLDQGDA